MGAAPPRPLTFREVEPQDPGFAAWPTDPVAPGARCFVAAGAGAPLARVSLQAAEDLAGAPGRVGMLGHYEASDAEAGAALLRHGTSLLRQEGAGLVLGPMNGSTWARYRLVLPGGPPVPWFFSEPRNPDEYPAHFEAAGFAPVAFYESRVAPAGGTFPDRLAARLAREGFEERAFDATRVEEELAALHAASVDAFAGNLYYRPITAEDFAALYRPLVPRLDPDLVRLVHAPDGTLAAYVLAFPDLLAPPGERLVLKTLAACTRWRNRGLGSYLTARIHALAAEKGYRQVIHALMHVSNASVGISGRTGGERIRQYALYGREA